jgi:hypothetical protein
MATHCLSSAMRPAKPLPSGIRTPWWTSSSIPRAVVAIKNWRPGSRSSTAAVSTDISSRTFSSSSSSSRSTVMWASPVSVTASSQRNRCTPSATGVSDRTNIAEPVTGEPGISAGMLIIVTLVPEPSRSTAQLAIKDFIIVSPRPR